jgi:hypothetical protein
VARIIPRANTDHCSAQFNQPADRKCVHELTAPFPLVLRSHRIEIDFASFPVEISRQAYEANNMT